MKNQENFILGLELGSTRIKAVLIDEDFGVVASGSHDWENEFVDGIWTYSLDDAWSGIQTSYKKLKENYKSKYGENLIKIKAMGFSAMMHGYLAFDKDGGQISQFRTWRNTTTEVASQKLSEEFQFNIPQRWSIAHLYQAILNGEENVKDIAFLTTLAGYVHYKLTGKKVLGVGEASGMFPINSEKKPCFDEVMMDKFQKLIDDKNYDWKLSNILPEILMAGDMGGYLTEEGAKLIDPSGDLCGGIPLCPPEGDAGTGMVATCSIKEKTGNISAGTSIFAMIVLEKALSKMYPEIDMVTTPDGKPVAMVHCNNCSSDIDAWAEVFQGFSATLGNPISLYNALDQIYFEALKGDADCGGLVSYNYLAGEPVTNTDKGVPLFMRTPNSNFTFQNFSRNLIYSAVATLKLGMDILIEKENVSVEALTGHGGFFKATEVGQKLMAGALKTPISVMKTASEGGPWGVAILARYMTEKEEGESLSHYLNEKVFKDNIGSTIEPSKDDVEGFQKYMESYVKGLAVEKEAIKQI